MQRPVTMGVGKKSSRIDINIILYSYIKIKRLRALLPNQNKASVAISIVVKPNGVICTRIYLRRSV